MEEGNRRLDLLGFGRKDVAVRAREPAVGVRIQGSEGALAGDRAASRAKGPDLKVRVFINYRRNDSEGYARWLFDRLGVHLRKAAIFVDAGGIGPGLPISRVIHEKVRTSDVMLALIGPQWLTAEVGGRPRLADPGDWVRLELAAAFGRDIPVIPVLVDRARMPKACELPPGLDPLADLHALTLGDNWDQDATDLVAAIWGKVDSYAPADRAWAHIPGGTFTAGPDLATLKKLAKKHAVTDHRLAPILLGGTRPEAVAAFRMATTCVTNEEYYAFTRRTGHRWPMPAWTSRHLDTTGRPFAPGDADLPVVNVSFTDAEEYAAWSRTRLPRWQQWEWAACRPDRRAYPWGSAYDAARCNSATMVLADVGAYPAGDSRDGVRQLCGNVAEWVVGVAGRPQTRGGSCRTECEFWGLAHVFQQSDGSPAGDVGFRVVR